MHNTLTLLQAINALKNFEVTVVDLVSSCLAQIKKYDTSVKAFVSVLDEEVLLAHARKCDLQLKDEGPDIFNKYPLFGIPYACKDNFNTFGLRTTASSNMLKNYVSPYESTVTQKLKDAGAILIGKTNMDAFAHGASTETSDFFTTLNPWDTQRVPGGSSGGSAAAVAANMCIFAIGSETAGSIRGPASWCGITGLKPTYGRVSRYGVIAMASSTDSPGPMTKTVEDAALVLSVIDGHDVQDATSAPAEEFSYSDLSDEFSLKGLRLGIPRAYMEVPMEAGVKNAFSEAIEQLKLLGASVTELDVLDPKYSIAVYTILQRAEVSSNLARLDGIRYGETRNSFGFEAKKRMMLGAHVLSSGYYDEYYSKAQRVRTLIINDFNAAYENVDLIVAPTMPCVAMSLGANETSALFGEFIDMLLEPSAVSGLPAVSIPCGFSEELPVGLQLIGPKFSEKLITNVAALYQRTTDFHKKLPSLEGLERGK